MTPSPPSSDTGCRSGAVTPSPAPDGRRSSAIPPATSSSSTNRSRTMATQADVRKIALSLPETTEEPWYGAPAYKVKGKGFLRLRAEAEGGLVVFISGRDEKQALLS